jgi:hypothetical protein
LLDRVAVTDLRIHADFGSALTPTGIGANAEPVHPFRSFFLFFFLLSTYGVPRVAPSLSEIEARRSSGIFAP